MIPLFFAVFGFFSLVYALEIKDIAGRVDYQKSGSLEWLALRDGGKVGNNEVFRLQERSRLRFQDSAGFDFTLYGPGQIRVNQILDMAGGKPTQILGELRGLFHVNWTGVGLAKDRFICNNVALHSFRGPGQFFCGADSLILIIWMEPKGQMTAQRGESNSVRVESGRVLLMRTIQGKSEDQFVDSSWAGAYLRERFGEAAPQEHKQGRVRLIWSDKAPVPQGTNWHVGAFLGSTLRKLNGVVFTEDTLAWTVRASLEQFQVQPQDGIWRLDLKIRFQIENRDMPLQNKEVLFERHEQVPDSTPNRFGLLRLLPMDHANHRIENSRFGQLAKELGDFFLREIVNPFNREGF